MAYTKPREFKNNILMETEVGQKFSDKTKEIKDNSLTFDCIFPFASFEINRNCYGSHGHNSDVLQILAKSCLCARLCFLRLIYKNDSVVFPPSAFSYDQKDGRQSSVVCKKKKKIGKKKLKIESGAHTHARARRSGV